MTLTPVLHWLENHTPRLIRLLVWLRKGLTPLDRRKASSKAILLFATLDREPPSVLPLTQSVAWRQAFAAYLRQFPRRTALVESFATSQFETRQQADRRPTADEPILICVVKDDLARLQMVFDHHRRLGVHHFAIVDNGSSDDTLEWLIQQPDADVYRLPDRFESQRKYGWINRVLAAYGFERWYLYVDSDELFVYPGCETIPLPDYCRLLAAKGQTRAASLMLDLYSDQPLFAPLPPGQTLSSFYSYFDTDSYAMTRTDRGLAINGGPRQRLFSASAADSPLLVKHPLFRLEPGLVFESAHYLYPFSQSVQLGSALLHYKFLPTDLARYGKIAKDGNFQGGSREYVRYMQAIEKEKALSFLYNGSARYVDSESLAAIPLITPIHEEDLS
jgi:hypothetical protein